MTDILRLEDLLRRKWLHTALVHSRKEGSISIESFQTLLNICCTVYDNETSVLVRFIVSNLITRTNEMKILALQEVVKTNNVELIKACFYGDESKNILNSEYYESFLKIALKNGNGESLVYLSNLPISRTMTPLKGTNFGFYFSSNSERSPANCFSIQKHKNVIDQLLLRGASLYEKKTFAMEYLFKSKITRYFKPELSDFLLSRGATLNDCDPKKKGHSLLTIAISKADECSVAYLLKKAKMEQGYETKYMSAAEYEKALEICLREWVCAKKKNFRNRDNLCSMIKHAASVEDKTIERIVMSPKIVGEETFLKYLLEHHRQAMMSYEKWTWTHGMEVMRKHTLRKYYRDEFAATIMLGTKSRLNQKSVLRHLDEDHLLMIFDALFY